MCVSHRTPKFQPPAPLTAQLLHPKLYNNDYALEVSSVLEIYLSFPSPATITFNAFCFTCTSSRLSLQHFFHWCKFRVESSTPLEQMCDSLI